MHRSGHGLIIGAICLLGWIGVPAAQEQTSELSTLELLALIDANGKYAFAAAAADIGIAKARLEEANSALYPSLSLDATGQRYQSTPKYREDNAEVYGTLEVVQPIYDFGQSGAEIAAADSEVAAAQ